MTKPVTFREYRPGDEAAILELFRIVYDREMSLQAWQWRFQQSPGGPGVIELAFDGDKLVGHYAVTSIRLAHRGEVRLSGLSGTTMTHPDARGAGLFTDLAKRAYERMRAQGAACVWGFPNSNSHRGFIRSLGWSDIHEIPFFTLELGSGPEVGAGRHVEPLRDVEGLDDLWARCVGQHDWSVVRDAAYVRWRFLTHPGQAYTLHSLRDDSGLLGYVVVKEYGASLQIVDVLAAATADAVDLVKHVIGVARASGKTRVDLWLTLTSPLHHELERLGFRPGGPVTYFGAAPLALACEGIFEPGRWRYAMSDSDVF